MNSGLRPYSKGQTEIQGKKSHFHMSKYWHRGYLGGASGNLHYRLIGMPSAKSVNP
jgi:hypothetical protein